MDPKRVAAAYAHALLLTDGDEVEALRLLELAIAVARLHLLGRVDVSETKGEDDERDTV